MNSFFLKKMQLQEGNEKLLSSPQTNGELWGLGKGGFDFIMALIEEGKKKAYLRGRWWNPLVGCIGRKDRAKEACIKVVGLPLHLWTRGILKKVGDNYSGFVAMDKGTALL